jgi:hypothetical protein
MNALKTVSIGFVTLGILLTAPTRAEAHFAYDSPLGGEVLVAGSTHTISWRILVQHGLENWDIWYSVEGFDGPWIPIVIDLDPGDPTPGSVHTFDWTVPAELFEQVRIRMLMDNVGENQDIYSVTQYDFFIVDEIGAPTFVRADCNSDGTLNIADAVAILDYLFGNASTPTCFVACDVNDDDQVNLADAVSILGYSFSDGAPPIVPFPHCGWDPTEGSGDCRVSTAGCP